MFQSLFKYFIIQTHHHSSLTFLKILNGVLKLVLPFLTCSGNGRCNDDWWKFFTNQRFNFVTISIFGYAHFNFCNTSDTFCHVHFIFCHSRFSFCHKHFNFWHIVVTIFVIVVSIYVTVVSILSCPFQFLSLTISIFVIVVSNFVIVVSIFVMPVLIFGHLHVFSQRPCFNFCHCHFKF